MRKRNEDRERARRKFADGDLADSNEQELEKTDIGRGESTVSGKGDSKPSKKRLSERIPQSVREESSENVLPTPWEENRMIRAETDTPDYTSAKESSDEKEFTKSNREKGKKRAGFLWRAVALMALFVLLALTILAGAYAYSARWEEETPPPTADDTEAETAPSRVIFVRQDGSEIGRLTAPELYAACADTVVSILTESEGRESVGSGFFLRSDGYIGTAYHVIEGSQSQTVVLSDGSRYNATLVAGNALTDLALLKIEGQGFPAVTPGASSELLVGERVYAIGTPASLDYAGSISSGEVSYLGRTVRTYREDTGAPEKKMTLIQTTTPVNRGNSGCPLFDGYGNLVGIVTMRLGDTFAGIGFAIPADGALPILNAMIEGAALDDGLLSSVAVSAPRLGVLGEADSEGGVCGVRIVGFPEGETEGQGLKAGDLILRIDGQPVCTTAQIQYALREKDPEDKVSVTVLRGAQSLTFEIVLGK